jgi:FtsP/CotA-like multicopper oxidase with cupredoxin domain
MSRIYLPGSASRARLKAAREAKKHRQDILTALSHGKVSRRDLLKMGLFTTAGLMAPIRGLNPFVGSVSADSLSSIPTGLAPSPLFGVQAFSQAMPRFDVLDRYAMSALPTSCSMYGTPPSEYSNQTLRAVHPDLGGGMGPIEGRPPGQLWSHQNWNMLAPKVGVEVTSKGAAYNNVYNPGVASSMNSGINPMTSLKPAFHPNLPAQDPRAMWTFNGTIPPKLLIGRYGEPICFRHNNGLPTDVTQNYGFGRHTLSTHEHNGHHGAENDGFTGAFFFPNQFYDYHYPIVLAGMNSINANATDIKASSPTDAGGLMKVPGDWHETMSTHWFHDHMFSFTSQNVYKGSAGMFNIYSGIDRGAEDVVDGVNLRLPSGRANVTGKSWGNLDYDVNLMLADKAWDQDGQLAMDIFQFDGFLGDQMTVNLAHKPYFEVERRKYRFRILNASVSRFFKIALSDSSQMIQIGNDGNLLPRPVTLTQLDEQGIAERYDIVIDFSRYQIGQKVWMVNLCEHQSGTGPAQDVSIAVANAGASPDPCVGKFLEFRIVRNPAQPDMSVVPPVLIPNPDLTNVPIAAYRTFEFGRDGFQNTSGPTSANGPWTVATDGGIPLNADYGRISAAPRMGTREVWTLNNAGGGWDHPVHIHFEEGQILARNGSASGVPLAEKGRKDVYRLRPAGSVQLTMQFRDFGGTYMEHCHNTVHEDNAMLLRWEVNPDGSAELHPLPTPIPTPQGVTFVDADDVLPTARK